MLLIFTNSIDTTTDLMLDQMPDIPAFRFNIDLWKQYSWCVDSAGFVLEDPAGRQCDHCSTVMVYQRKPIFLDFIDVPAGGNLENWCREEVTEVWKNIYFEYCAQGRASLVYPVKNKWGKIRQLWLAKQFFPIAEWYVFQGKSIPSASEPQIAKALTQTPIGAGKFLFTKQVDPKLLAPEYPWFLQTKVEASADVTVVYVDGDLFAFELDRESFSGLDYRVHVDVELPWKPCALSSSEKDAICKFMSKTGYEFGRFDFLRKNNELIFLELNPNGQWAWLDPNDEFGLLSRITGKIRQQYMDLQAACL